MEEAAKQSVVEKALNKGREIEVAGKEILVKEFSLLANLREITSVLKALVSLSQVGEADMPAMVLALVGEKKKEMLALIESSTGLKEKDLLELEKEEPAAFIIVAMAVYEENKSFLERAGKTLKLSKKV